MLSSSSSLSSSSLSSSPILITLSRLRQHRPFTTQSSVSLHRRDHRRDVRRISLGTGDAWLDHRRLSSTVGRPILVLWGRLRTLPVLTESHPSGRHVVLGHRCRVKLPASTAPRRTKRCDSIHLVPEQRRTNIANRRRVDAAPPKEKKKNNLSKLLPAAPSAMDTQSPYARFRGVNLSSCPTGSRADTMRRWRRRRRPPPVRPTEVGRRVQRRTRCVRHRPFGTGGERVATLGGYWVGERTEWPAFVLRRRALRLPAG